MHAGRDEWPVTVVGAYHLMIKTQEQLIEVETRLARTNQGRGRGRGSQFVQHDENSGRGRGGRAQYSGRGRGGRSYQPPTVPEGACLVPGVDGTTMDLR